MNMNMKKTSKLLTSTAYFSLLMLQASFGYAVQTCNDATIATTPTTDFTVHANGTVTHKKTGLMWKVCSEGQTWDSANGSCGGVATFNFSWDQALKSPETLNNNGGYPSTNGFDDWRLPNVKELKFIVEQQCYSPAINEAVFSNQPTNAAYWSSSPYTYYDTSAWVVNFATGSDGFANRATGKYVRLVRSGQ